MDCIKTICFYLKKYISIEQFESIFCEYLSDFENCLEKEVYLHVFFTNFKSKEERISMETELRHYILKNHKFMYETINDAYIERMIEADAKDILVELLKEKYKQPEKINIDCNKINTSSEFIGVVKQTLNFPQFCGNSWDSIEDLIYDIILPKKIIFCNWHEIEHNLPQDTAILKTILDKHTCGRCIIIYD